MFTGRTPYVWLSNQYANTGIDFTRLSVTYRATNTVTFVPDPNNQPKNVGGAATNEIDLIDPDYKYPSIVRTNLAYDRALGFWGLVGTAEVLFSKTLEDVKYNNLNLIQTGTRPDGRPFTRGCIPTLSNTLLLTNTTKGSNYSITGKVDRPFSNGWFATGSYLYGDASTIQDGTNSTAFSTWANVYTINTSDPPLTRSNFSVGHRITLSGSKTVPFRQGRRGHVLALLQRPVGQALRRPVQRRRQRRQPHDERPALRPCQRGRGHHHEWHVGRPGRVSQQRLEHEEFTRADCRA